MRVTPIWAVARNWSMLSWRYLPRRAPRLPSSISDSTRLRRAEMIAISLPEKKPLPSRQKRIAIATRTGSDMTCLSIVPKRSPCQPSPRLVAWWVARHGGRRTIGQRGCLRRDGDRKRPRRLRGRDPGRPAGAEDRGGGARPRGVRWHLPPARLHPHEGPPPHRGSPRGRPERQGPRHRRGERVPRLPRPHEPQGPHRPPAEQGDRDLPLQEEQDHALPRAGPARGGEGGGGQERAGRHPDPDEERHPRHRLAPQEPPRARPRR